MSEPSAQKVVEIAQQRQQTRKIAIIETRTTRELPWRYAFFGLLGALLLGLLAWPGTPLEWKMYAAVHGVCAQIHNVEIGGMQLPICARNSGIYSSFLVTTLYLLALGRGCAAKLPPWPIMIVLGLFVGAMAVDGINSMMVDMYAPHLYTPRNELRTLTGTGTGIAIAVTVIMLLNASLRRDADSAQPVMMRWRELGGALLLNGLLLVAMYGNIGLMYWPLAFLAWGGIIGVLYAVNVLMAALMFGYEGSVTRLAQLAKPATLAIIFTALQLGALAYARFWLEATGVVVSG